jgi:dTDP-glucose pyrophosphorylase
MPYCIDAHEHCILSSASLLEAVKLLAALSHKIVLVVNEHHELLGTVVDGDVRRALLKGMQLHDAVSQAMFRSPHTVQEDAIARVRPEHFDAAIKYLPVLAQQRVVSLLCFDAVHHYRSGAIPVVIMVGGLGSRMGELTQDCPKPMLAINGKPILEHIVDRLSGQGFHDYYFAVNYKSSIIENHFGDGDRFGIRITYLREKKRMGTAGALSLLPDPCDKKLLVMNGDILSQIDYQALLAFHNASGASITAAVTIYQQQVPFGVVHVEKQRMLAIKEKPVLTHFVNAGIYVINPERIHNVPKDTFFDMPDLLQQCIDTGDFPAAFPMYENWMDIGTPVDFQKANTIATS